MKDIIDLAKLEAHVNENLKSIYQNDRIKEKQNLKVKRLWELGKQLFTNDKGTEFLELLKEIYLLSPVSSASYSERISCVREGQNEMVRLFINMTRIKFDEMKKREVIYE